MSKKVVKYPRVSCGAQASEERVSIEQQLAEMDKLIERNNWTVVGVYNEEEVIIVRLIFELADKGLSINEIREELIAREARQKYNKLCNLLPAKEEPTGRRNRHRWSQTVINDILRCPDYMGKLDYAHTLLTSIEQRLPKINQTLDELKVLPREQQDKILTERKQIIQALCKKVTIHRDGQIVIDGMVDGTKLSIFEATVTKTSSNLSSCLS